jgi:hypothetical protein
MTIARSIASGIARSIGSSLDGAGGGGAPDPYGPELLTNVEFAGYVAGSPGTPPTGWTALFTSGLLSAPQLTFGATASQQGIYKLFSSSAAGRYKLETTAVVNSGSVALQDVLYHVAPVTSTYSYFVDDVAALATTTITGTSRLKIVIDTVEIGNLQFRIGVGLRGNRTQNVTHSNPSFKKLI